MFGRYKLSWVVALTSCFSIAGAAGFGHPVTVIESLNDGNVPVSCGVMNSNANGVFEVSLDVDEDGIEDICLGSGSNTCAGGFNFDCASGLNNSLCSTEDNNTSNTLMAADVRLSTHLGDAVGPNFINSTDSTDGVPTGEALVIGFLGSSNYPGLRGYFGLNVDETDCSYTFTNAIFDDGDGSILYGDEPEFVVNSVADLPDQLLDGVCDTGNAVRGTAECTLRAALQESNQIAILNNINFAIPAIECPGGSCVIDVDITNNGLLPDIITPVMIDGTTQAGSETLCQTEIAARSQYGIVIQGDSTDVGLRLAAGGDGSTIKGLNIRNFFNNIAIINSDNNHIQCNFIGTDETGTFGSGGNGSNGIIFGCDSNDNIIGGPNPQDGNLIANQDSDGIQFFAGFDCGPISPLPHNNAILGNFIGTAKDGTSPLGNAFSGISFFGGAAFNNYVGSLQDGITINGNVIGDNESGIYIDDGTNNTVIKGNYLGTDLSGTANLGNLFGGVDIILGQDNQIGGINPGDGNVITNNSEGVFVTGLTSAGNQIRGNASFDNLTTAIDIIIDGGINPDGSNPNDSDDADTGANLLMNYPTVLDTSFVNALGDNFVGLDYNVDASSANALYPLQIDGYFDENPEGSQGGTFVVGGEYTTPQTDAQLIFDIPDGVTGGVMRFTATDANGNTSEMSPPVTVGIIDLIFEDGFDGD